MSEKRWTADQKNAIEASSGSILVSAAAGSGKTAVLVERIVRLLTKESEPVTPDRLLVVTFTNAAAGEMRSRVMHRIAALGKEQPEKKKELNLLRARLSEAKICTMDAFCMSLVKENFHACDIEPDFRMLDTGEVKILKAQCIKEVIDELYEDEPQSFEPLSQLFEKGRSDSCLADGIVKLADFSMSQPFPSEWLDTAADNFNDNKPDCTVYGKIISDYISEGLEYCVCLAESALDDAGKDEELYAKCSQILSSDCEKIKCLSDSFTGFDWNEKIAELENTLRCLKAKALRAPNGYAENPYKLAMAEKRKEVKKLIEKFLLYMCANEDENADDVRVLKPIAAETVRAAKLFLEKLLAAKSELNAYDFPDISHFALTLLSDKNAADGKSDIARQLSENFSEILIDEYQDTNRAQDKLFLLLSHNGDNMFTVGDAKQSIYRFRLASPEIFMEKSESLASYDGKLKRSKIIFHENFRCRKGIISAVNFMFSAIMSKKSGEIDYNEDEKLNYGASYPETDEPDARLCILNNEGLSGTHAEAVYCAGLISDMLKNGAAVYENGVQRAAEPGDFAILLRSTSGDTVSLFAKELEKCSVPCSSNASSGFLETAEIRTMLSLLRVVDNPLNDVAVLSVMLSPLFGFTADDAAAIKISARKKGRGRESLYSCVVGEAENGNSMCRVFCDRLSYYRKLSAVLPTGSVLREIYDDTSALSVCMAMKNSTQRRNNLLRLVEYADKLADSGNDTIGGFLRYTAALAENGANLESAAVQASSGEVSIMTMHRSKGLEFPFVIIAGLTRQFNRNDSRSELLISGKYGMGLKRQELQNIKKYDTLSSVAVKCALEEAAFSEELRIYYVAMTRAKEKLFIVIAPEKAEKKLLEAAYLLPEQKKIPPFAVKNVSNPARWFIMAFLHHPDADAIRLYGTYELPSDEKMSIELVNKVCEAEAEESKTEMCKPDKAICDEIAAKAQFTYAYAAAAGALSKRTASDLHAEKFESASFGKGVPAFISGEKLSSADVGTATHRFLEHCDFDAGLADALSEKKRLFREGRLTEDEFNAVDDSCVTAFFASELMSRARKAEKYYREKQFTVRRSICDFDDGIPEKFRDEKTVLIGKIDLIFIEDGKAVIVDYKTDRVSDINLLVSRYREQLDVYSDAVLRVLGVPVKSRYLYCLHLKQSIEV